jgi:hypothetical protein
MYQNRLMWMLVIVAIIVAADAVARLLLFRGGQGSDAVKSEPIAFRPFRFLVNAGALVCFALAAWTGFSGLYAPNGVLTGSGLMTHVTFAPAFAVSALVAAFFWAGRAGLSRVGSYQHPLLLRGIFFWVALALAAPTIVSVLLAMYPWVTPEQQTVLLTLHKTFAIPLAGATILFAWFALVTWWAERRG